jgi:hypothetical protein
VTPAAQPADRADIAQPQFASLAARTSTFMA